MSIYQDDNHLFDNPWEIVSNNGKMKNSIYLTYQVRTTEQFYMEFQLIMFSILPDIQCEGQHKIPLLTWIDTQYHHLMHPEFDAGDLLLLSVSTDPNSESLTLLGHCSTKEFWENRIYRNGLSFFCNGAEYIYDTANALGVIVDPLVFPSNASCLTKP